MKNLKRSFVATLDAPSPQDLFRQGIAHHQEGRLAEAKRMYEKLLLAIPNEPNVTQLLGVAYLQEGDLPNASTYLERAVRLTPEAGGAWLNLGNARLGLGDVTGSVAAYDEAVRLEPNNPEAHYNRANVFLQNGEPQQALEGYATALHLNPAHLGARFNQANALAALKYHEDAATAFLAVAEANPHFPNLWKNLGVSLIALERMDDAEAAFRTAAQMSPDDSQAHNNLGSVLARQERFKEAAEVLTHAVVLAPTDVTARLNLARAQQRAKDKTAVETAQIAVQLAPDSLDALCTLGDAWLAFGYSDEAMKTYERVMAMDPDCLKKTNNLGLAFFRVGKIDETITFFSGALESRPEDADAWGDLGIARLHSGDIVGALHDLRRSVSLNPEGEYGHSNLVLSHCYSIDHTGEDIRDEAIAWAAKHAPIGLELPPVHVGAKTKLRIGYLSADFHKHPAGYLYEAMFPFHDRSRFEVFTYSNKEYYDDVTRRIAAASDRWQVVVDHEDDELAQQIREDEIDILVDLLGHTPGHRLKMFARRPAPVQATWLGYFGTTGMSQIDFILGDRYVTPEEHDHQYVERVARMPGCLYVFQPPTQLGIHVNVVPALGNGHVTFGCFNNLSKISEPVVALWCEVLRATPNSRFIMNRWPFSSAKVRETYLQMFEASGVDRSRVELRATKERHEYFESYHAVDIMLDSFPFGGGTTTSEALWMGVPVITLNSDRFAGRMTESILHTVGHADLLPADRTAYVRLALDLAHDLPRLQALRSGLRADVETSPLCDIPQYTRDLEATFEWMWNEKLS